MKNCLVPERLAARFTRANSEYLSRANHANFSGHANGWWLAFWIKFHTLPSVGGYEAYVWSTYNAANNGVAVMVRQADDKAMVFGYGAVSDANKKFAGDALTADEWFFIYCDYDGVDLRILVNDYGIESTPYTDYVASNQSLHLGTGHPAGSYMDASLQCVMCGHPNILTAAEIAWLYSEVPKWNEVDTYGSYRSTQFGRFVAGVGAYGNGTTIPAKITAGWSLGEESNGTRAVTRMTNALGLTDNNTVTSAVGMQP